jgi:hypothetical protein
LAPVECIILNKLVSPIICVGQFNHQNQLGKMFDPISLSVGYGGWFYTMVQGVVSLVITRCSIGLGPTRFARFG